LIYRLLQHVAAINKQIHQRERKTMRFKFAIGFAALTFGVALASVQAIAQQGVSGYSSQGGVVAVHPYRHHSHMRPLYNFAPQNMGPNGNPADNAARSGGPGTHVGSERTGSPSNNEKVLGNHNGYSGQ
jgi:hypothetical protein